MKKIAFGILFFITVSIAFGQETSYLKEKKTGNHFLKLPISTKVNDDKLIVSIGSGNALKDMHGRAITLWLFHEQISFKELAKINNKVSISSEIESEVARTGFYPVVCENLVLETKTKYTQIANKHELIYKIKDPSAPSSLKLFFYPSEITNAKKNTTRFFVLLNPYIINIEGQKNSKRRSVVIETDSYTDPEQVEAATFERFCKNLPLSIEEAKKILEEAKEEHSAGNDISGYVMEMESIKSDIDFDKEDFRAQIRENEDARLNIKQFENIYRELIVLSNKPATPSDANAANDSEKEEDKKTNPMLYILMGVGGMLISGLLIMVVQNILQSIKDKKKEKKLAEEQKKILAEQERLMKEAQMASQPKIRKKI